MKSPSTFVAIIATLLLHVALVAAAVVGISTSRPEPAEPLPIAIELLPPPAPVQSTPPAPLPVAPAPASPENKRPKPKPVVKPKPAAKPRTADAPPVKEQAAPPEPVTTAPGTPALAAPAPVAPSMPAAAPSAPPVKTGVSIPATYAASNRKPVYPALSRRYEEQGTVVLRVLVKADGSAGTVEIKSSSGYRLLDESAKSTVQAWRFNPATSEGKPITEWYQLSIPFKLKD